jgi:2-desacetyl-2-hydroxyethyl bacteriochlorophyllide A dehydrogenase
MQAAILKAFGAPLVLENVEDPRAGPDDAVVRVIACGFDGTDLKLLDGFGYAPSLPFIMGHETAGIVETVGTRVTAYRPGDRVVAYNFVIPRDSPWFDTAREQIAPDIQAILGVRDHYGGFAERLSLPAAQLVHIPDDIGFADAAVHCDAGLTAFHAVRRARITAGETVLVIGAGGVGSFALQFTRLAGAQVVAIEQTSAKRDWALGLGALAAVGTDGVAAAVRNHTGGRGFDCVLDIVGTKETSAAAIEAAGRGGRIVIVGYTPDSFAISGKHIAQNEIELIGSRAGSRAELGEALARTAAGGIRSVVTDHFPLSGVNDGLAALRTGRILGRGVLDIGSEH